MAPREQGSLALCYTSAPLHHLNHWLPQWVFSDLCLLYSKCRADEAHVGFCDSRRAIQYSRGVCCHLYPPQGLVLYPACLPPPQFHSSLPSPTPPNLSTAWQCNLPPGAPMASLLDCSQRSNVSTGSKVLCGTLTTADSMSVPLELKPFRLGPDSHPFSFIYSNTLPQNMRLDIDG